MKWLIVIVLAGALIWDVRSRWRAEQELRRMPWPNWMAATDRSDALQVVVGPLAVNVLLIVFFVSATVTGAEGEPPPLASVLFAVLVFAAILALNGRNRARVQRGPVGAPLAQSRRANRSVEMEQTASIALAGQSFPAGSMPAGSSAFPRCCSRSSRSACGASAGPRGSGTRSSTSESGNPRRGALRRGGSLGVQRARPR